MESDVKQAISGRLSTPKNELMRYRLTRAFNEASTASVERPKNVAPPRPKFERPKKTADEVDDHEKKRKERAAGRVSRGIAAMGNAAEAALYDDNRQLEAQNQFDREVASNPKGGWWNDKMLPGVDLKLDNFSYEQLNYCFPPYATQSNQLVNSVESVQHVVQVRTCNRERGLACRRR